MNKCKCLFGLAIVLAACNHAQATIIYGSLSNFDCINDTGSTAHGFEIELDGISPADVIATFGAPPDPRGGGLASAIGESELLWGYLTNSALVSILCLPDASIQWASPSVYPILGHQAQTLTGVDLTMLIDDVDMDWVG